MKNFEPGNNDQAELGEPRVILDKDCLLLDSAFPTDEEKREICNQHLQEGRGADIMGSFWMLGCDFEGAAADDSKMHVLVSCKGISAFTKKCRLTLIQKDSNGKELSKGQWQEQLLISFDLSFGREFLLTADWA